MSDITCYDQTGNKLETLYQWDVNQTIRVSGLDMPPVPLCHFTNRLHKIAIVVEPTVQDEDIIVDVPNILLQEPETLTLYFFAEDIGTSSYRTIKSINIPVVPRPIPSDYVYTENIEYESLEALSARLNDLIFEYESGAEALALARNSIARVEIQYAKNQSSITPPASGWQSNAPQYEEGYFIWQRIHTTLAGGADTYSEAVCMVGIKGDTGDSGADGSDGTNGRSITSITEYYALAATSASSEGLTWSTTIPTMTSEYRYLWNYEVISYSDSTTSQSGKRVIGVYGDTGAAGADGADGRDGIDGADGAPGQDGRDGTSVTVLDVDIQYIASDDNTNVPDGIWSSSVVDVGEGDYLWTRTIISFSDGTSATSFSVARQGINGTDGTDGINGTSNYIHIKYSAVADPADNDMTEVPDDYIGICVDTTLADPTTASSYTWSRFTGQDGEDGLPGTNGTDGTPAYVHFAYATSADGQTDFSTTWFSGATYLGVLSDSTLQDSTVYSDYTWSLIKGDKGDTGNGISSTTVTYATSSTIPADPSALTWGSSIPSVQDGDYLWTRTIIDYTDQTVQDTVSYTYTRQGEDGQTGATGASITVTSIQYQAGSSATTAPTGTWSDSVVTVPEGQYLWTKTTFSDGSTAYGVARQGVNGTNGTNGTDGVSITGVTNYYLKSNLSSGVTRTGTSGWSSTTMPTVDSTNKYLWNYEDIQYSNNTHTYTDACIIGVYGDTGSTGKGISIVVEEYYLSTSHETATGGQWDTVPPAYQTNHYYWTRDHITYDDTTDAYTEAVLNNALNSANETALNSAMTATNYITTVDNNQGIKVHAYQDTANYVQMNSSGVDIYVGNTKTASYGSAATIGVSGEVQAVIDGDSFDLEKSTTSNNTTTTEKFFHAGYDTNAVMEDGTTGSAPFYDLGLRNHARTGTDADSASIPVGAYSVVEGIESSASAFCSHAEGRSTSASGGCCHAEGVGLYNSVTQTVTITEASGTASHAEGVGTKATGVGSHAEGVSTRASGVLFGSHAEGFASTASGDISHAEGAGTTASGNYSHSEGSGCVAAGENSHAQNEGTIANGDEQTVIGRYNVADNSGNNGVYALIIGNGTSNNTRSNALAVKWDGDIVFKDVTSLYDELFYKSEDTFSLAVKSFTDANIGSGTFYVYPSVHGFVSNGGKDVELTVEVEKSLAKINNLSITVNALKGGLRSASGIVSTSPPQLGSGYLKLQDGTTDSDGNTDWKAQTNIKIHTEKITDHKIAIFMRNANGFVNVNPMNAPVSFGVNSLQLTFTAGS